MTQHVSGDIPPIIKSSKTVIAASGFTHVFGCRPLRWLSHCSNRQPLTCVKPEAAITVFELLLVGGVSPETCWAVKKHWNNKFYCMVASCWFFLQDLCYYARIHEHHVSDKTLKNCENLVAVEHWDHLGMWQCVSGWIIPADISRDHSAIIFRVKRLLELHDPEDAGTLILRNIRNNSPGGTASHPEDVNHEPQPWEPQ